MLCISVGCLSSKKTTADNNIKDEIKELECKSITLDPASYRSASDDPYELKNATIENGCLVLNVSYGGGCGKANFDMVGHETQTKAPPPIFLLRLALTDRDNCRSMVDTTLYFSLDGIQKSKEQVMLRLKNWDKNLYL